MPADSLSKSTETHLTRARGYIAKGDDFYRKAVEEIVQAQQEHRDQTGEELTYVEIGRQVGRSDQWVGTLVRSWTSSTRASDGDFQPDWKSGSNKRDEVARKVLRDPEERAKVFSSLSEAELDDVEQAASTGLVERSRAARAEHEDGVTPGSEGVSPDEFSKHWADGPLLSLVRKVRSLKGLVAQQGLILGSLSNEEALDIANEAEAGIAEIRAALQERVRDEEMVSNG